MWLNRGDTSKSTKVVDVQIQSYHSLIHRSRRAHDDKRERGGIYTWNYDVYDSGASKCVIYRKSTNYLRKCFIRNHLKLLNRILHILLLRIFTLAVS